MSIDPALATLAEETIWSGCAAYAADPQVEVGNRWYVTGCRYPGLNGVFPARGAADAPVDIAAVLAPFQRRRVPMLWHLGPGAPHLLASRLRAAGCVYDHQEPLMVADLGTRTPRPPDVPGLEIVLADSDSGVTEFARVWSGRADPPDLDRLVRLRRCAPGTFSHVVGLLDGVPVACAAAFHGPDAAEVQHVVTAQAVRRRGIGTALTWHLLALLRDQAMDTAVLTASPYGIRIYQQLGFRRVGAVRRYRWRPAC